MKRRLAALSVTLLLTLGLSTVAAGATADPIINVDGVEYSATKVVADGGTIHFETPDTNPVSAFTVRNTWTGNGSEHLPCPAGIHWIDNKNVLTISHCLPTETTTTTEQETTTTTEQVTTTTQESTTTTTSQDTTTTTEGSTLQVKLEVDCDHLEQYKAAQEPILTWWSGNYTPGDPSYDIYIAVESPIGTFIGNIEPSGPTTQGFHDSWVSGNHPVGDSIKATLYINGVVEATASAICSSPASSTTISTLPFTGLAVGSGAVLSVGLMALGLATLSIHSRLRGDA